MLIHVNNVLLNDICRCWGQVGLSKDPSSCSTLGPQSKLPLDGMRGHILVCPHSQQFLGSVLELEMDNNKHEREKKRQQMDVTIAESNDITPPTYTPKVPIGSPLCCKVRSQNDLHLREKKRVSLTRLRALALVSLRILTQITIRMGMTKQAPWAMVPRLWPDFVIPQVTTAVIPASTKKAATLGQ